MNNFYSNLPNTSRSQFQFDKIYPNRMTMELHAKDDEVFVGRYVLVEYDTAINTSFKIRAYRKDSDFAENNYLYGDSDLTQIVSYSSSTDSFIDPTRPYNVVFGVYTGIVVYVIEHDQSLTFYQCVGQNGEHAVFQAISSNENYTYNYTQDKNWAYIEGISFGKGWDSTVWLKVFAEGESKYIMVAELNTALPVFTISSDAPTISPVPPHFDERSNNQYYILHQQPQWGIRIKSAYSNLLGPMLDKNGQIDSNINIYMRQGDSLNYPSDLKINWEKTEYDSSNNIIDNYIFNLPISNNSHIGTWVNKEGLEDVDLRDIMSRGLPAAVYFNKDGLDVKNIRKSSDLFDPQYRLTKFNYVSDLEAWPSGKIEDKIEFTPTGLSGHRYNRHDGRLDQIVEPDTYELSIMLPSLGDMVSDIWDLIYGGRNIASIQTSNKRNTKIDWEDVSLGGEKTGLRLISSLGGGSQAYKVSEINTLAGCINSVHDLMGMIIHDMTGENIDLTNQNDIDTLSEEYIYYYGNTYYRKRQFYIYEPPSGGEELKKYELMHLTPFVDNTYYKKVASNYLLLTTVPEDRLTVYTKGTFGDQIQFSDTYKANKFYYRLHVFPELDPDDPDYNLYNYYLDTSPIQSADRDYVSLIKYNSEGETIYEYDEQGNLVTAPVLRYLYFYEANKYYYHNDPESTDFILDTGDEIVEGRDYYYQQIKRTIDSVTHHYIIEYTYGIIPRSKMVMFERGKYYEYNSGHNSYILLDSQPEIDQNHIENGYSCYTLPYIDHSVLFYQPNRYYYGSHIYPEASVDDPNYDVYNYLLDTSANYTPGRIYYTSIEMIPHQYNFYRPNVYYATDSESIEPRDDAQVTTVYDASKTYWRKQEIYVASDPNNIYRTGARWKLTSADAENAGIVLCNRELRWGMEELEDFCGNLNTLFGLLLRTRSLLDEGYQDTRELTTVQGCINTLNDMIDGFGATAVGNIMATNPYGQIAGYEPHTNSWISVTLNNTNNRITFNHKTINNVSGSYGDSAAPASLGFGDSFKVPYITVDGAGHITGISDHDITIPTGSLSDNAANGADVITQLSFTAASGALSTTRANIGTLKLTGYSIASSASAVAATDTINQAFGKVQKSINNINNVVNIIKDSTSTLTYDNDKTYILSRDSSGVKWIALDTWSIGGSY